MNHYLESSRLVRIGKQGVPAYAVAHSADGQYTAVATEDGMTLFDKEGELYLRFPEHAWPIHLLVAPGDFSYLLVGTRRGAIIRLDLEQQVDKQGDAKPETHFAMQEENLYFAENNLNSLALAEGENAVIGIGHFSPAVTLMTTTGETIWHKSPSEKYWVVGLDQAGSRLYAASAGTGTNRLVALDTSNELVQTRKIDGRITKLAVLPEAQGVVVVVNDGYSYWLQAYTADLQELLWENEYDAPVTAVAADRSQPLLAIACGYHGELAVLDAKNGTQLTDMLSLQVYVNDIAMSNGDSITAVTEDGTLAMIKYQSPNNSF